MEDADLESQSAFIRDFPERDVFHVAVCDKSQRILGMQDVLPVTREGGAAPEVGEISTFVAMGEQGKGIGRDLSQTTFREARRKGMIKLAAAIRADNTGAVAFYRALGFRFVESARNRVLANGESVAQVIAEMPLAG